MNRIDIDLTTGPRLNDDQQAAVNIALGVAKNAGHMALIGPAGTGKTTTIRAIAHALQKRQPTKGVLLLAPTHKARRQLAAAELPRLAQAWTVQKVCQVKPQQWRDEDRFQMTGDMLRMVAQIQKKFSFIIVDESSMVVSEYASTIVQIASEAGIGVMFAGDPYQLPPVQEKIATSDDDFDEFADDGPENAMAQEFVNAPVIARLNRVMRHGGPILSFATSIREAWSNFHGFPAHHQWDEESRIELSKAFEADFIQRFQEVLQKAEDAFDSHGFLYKKAPRALCHQNRTVHTLTKTLRQRIYGEAMVTWQPGEIITFPSYTKAGDNFIASSTDAIVIDSEIVEVSNLDEAFAYTTVVRNEHKKLRLSFSGTFQRLTVQTLKPDGSPDMWGESVVHAPLCGDREPVELYGKLKEAIQNRRLGAQHPSWIWLKEEVREKYIIPIHSAFVMTIHKSQGSTFENVFVDRDLLFVGPEDRDTRNALLYVAATRASKSLTFGAADADA